MQQVVFQNALSRYLFLNILRTVEWCCLLGMTWLPIMTISLSPCSFPGNTSESEEDHSAGSVESQAVPSTHRVTDSKFHPLHAKMGVIKKGHARDSQRYKVDYESQSTDTQNFSSESKRETEYVRIFPLVGGGERREHPKSAFMQQVPGVLAVELAAPPFLCQAPPPMESLCRGSS